MPINHSTPKPLQVAAAAIGNALEWYDFIIFGVLTVVISRLFFPAESQYASLLLTTRTFGVCFFMRPVGGILLGIYAYQRSKLLRPAPGPHELPTRSRSANGMVWPCSCPASDRNWQGAPKTSAGPKLHSKHRVRPVMHEGGNPVC